MTARTFRLLRPLAGGRWLFCLVLALVLGAAGCSHPQTRGQADDEPEHERYDVETVGDILDSVSNADPIPVSGIGLVTGLDGTGGSPPPGDYRTMLKDQLQKQGHRNPDEILNSSDNSLVLVSALIPPGAHKGDPIDVQVSLPPQSRTTSLRGGYLEDCGLMDYDTTQNLDPTYNGSNRAVMGHVRARAKGHLLAGFGDGDDNHARQGRIWGGGRCNMDRSFYLVLNPKHQHVRDATTLADKINATFHGTYRGVGSGALAEAQNPTVVEVNVPQQYKLNQGHFLRVVKLIPLRQGVKSKKKDNAEDPGLVYRRQLEEDLLDPSHCVTAALRLEALGTESIPALKRGLARKEHVLVRFCAAEALAYLDCSACGEELGEIVKSQWALRSYALTALASLDEAVSRVKLHELLLERAPETRYGAFRALRALDEHDPLVQGELLNDDFWLHRVAPDTEPLVHFSTTRRPEIVLFGQEPSLKPPFWFVAGDFTITSGDRDTRCTITRRSLRLKPEICQCSLQLEEILRTLARLGAQYPEAVELLHQTEVCQCLSCPMAVDALPQATNVHELARAGKSVKHNEELRKAGINPDDLPETDAEILSVRSELGSTPNLYEKSSGRRPLSAVERDDQASLHDRSSASDSKAASRPVRSVDQ